MTLIQAIRWGYFWGRFVLASHRRSKRCAECGGLLDGPDRDWCPACAYGSSGKRGE
jgi:hypothetical protein